MTLAALIPTIQLVALAAFTLAVAAWMFQDDKHGEERE